MDTRDGSRQPAQGPSTPEAVAPPAPTQTAFLVALGLVFTVGLTFATVELPYLLDGLVMQRINTPGFDSQVDLVSRLKTELFISHYHLRAIGYISFGALLFLIGAGFATRRSGLAMLGGMAFMLPVFAQFAGVMFFLSGLGILNVLWLPVLDVSFAMGESGAVVRAPYDGLRWLLGLVGVNGYWPLVYFFIGSGFLLFFAGTLAWLRARSRHLGVADFWVYRFSRHPQYVGWILWSYGLFLLLLQGRYPKRSWGISASFPWLISTVVIIGVAMLEELGMRRRFGEEYEKYRRSAPFLFPLPGFAERLFALPFRLFFGKERPDRRREVAAVLSFYTVLLVAASLLFYGSGMDRLMSAFRSEDAARTHVAGLVRAVRDNPGGRSSEVRIAALARAEDPAPDSILALLTDPAPAVRTAAAQALTIRPDERAVPLLVGALADSTESVRWRAYEALDALGSPEAVEPLAPLLSDPAMHIRLGVLGALARRGAPEVIPAATELLTSRESWVRVGAAGTLGTLGSEAGIPLLATCLDDESAWVRQEAVMALLRIGSPTCAPALQGALDDEDWEVRLYAEEALKRVLRGRAESDL